MAVIVEVKSHNPTVKEQLEALARRVRDEFATDLPDLKLLAFFDDLPWTLGPENRGFYTPIDKNTFRGYQNLPQGLGEKIFGTSLWVPGSKRTSYSILRSMGLRGNSGQKVGLFASSRWKFRLRNRYAGPTFLMNEKHESWRRGSQ